jgi:phosphoglycerate dehydrogenase-like enzyme
LTPHIGGSTAESVANISSILMEQAAAVFFREQARQSGQWRRTEKTKSKLNRVS